MAHIHATSFFSLSFKGNVLNLNNFDLFFSHVSDEERKNEKITQSTKKKMRKKERKFSKFYLFFFYLQNLEMKFTILTFKYSKCF